MSDERPPAYWEDPSTGDPIDPSDALGFSPVSDAVLVLRASSIGDCEQKLFRHAIGDDLEHEEWRGLRVAAERGQEQEAEVVRRLEDLGFRIEGRQREVEARIGRGIVVRGHVDGIVSVIPDSAAFELPDSATAPILLEVKTRNEKFYDAWINQGYDAFPQKAYQVSVYARALGLNPVVLCAVLECGVGRQLQDPSFAPRFDVRLLPCPVPWAKVVARALRIRRAAEAYLLARDRGFQIDINHMSEWGKSAPPCAGTTLFCPFACPHNEAAAQKKAATVEVEAESFAPSIARYKAISSQIAILEKRKKDIQTAAVDLLGAEETDGKDARLVTAAGGTVTRTWSTRFDAAAFKSAYPDLHADPRFQARTATVRFNAPRRAKGRCQACGASLEPADDLLLGPVMLCADPECGYAEELKESEES